MSENTLSISDSLMDAIRVIEATAKRLAVVISDSGKVLGTLTDGDIRRAVLGGHNLETMVDKAMHKDPLVADVNTSDSALRDMLASYAVRSLPLVGADGRYVRTLHEMELHERDKVITEKIFSVAIIMAGGEGIRLRPLTEDIPKPMVEIDGIPLLERQIRRLSTMGIKQIYISVNYLSKVIEDYFGVGEGLGVDIHYLHEDKKLGTAGALSLLPKLNSTRPVLVMNGDILTTSDFVNLFHFHEYHHAIITISAVDYNIKIPFGVIQHDGARVTALQEKPSQRFFCNAGMYALSVDALKKIPADTFWNMTDLIDQCLADGDNVSVFPVHEYWSDIGTPADLEKARAEFNGLK
jgi:dTDP-glucose pyrophosphorylase